MASGKLLVKLVALTTVLMLFAGFFFNRAMLSDLGFGKRVMSGLGGILSLCIAVVFIVIAFMKTSPYYDVVSSLRHLYEVVSVDLTGRQQLSILRNSWKDVRRSQERLLLEFLRENAETEYGKDYHLNEIRSLEEFRQRHPVTTYEHYRAYVERVMNGERNVMTQRPPTNFVRTTGTTGQSKFIPHVMRLRLLETMFGRNFVSARENFPQLGFMQKRFLFYVAPKTTKTKGGTNITAFLALSTDEEHKLTVYTTPPAGFRISNLKDACYVHSLFAIREPSTAVFFSFFIHYMESMLKLLKRSWYDIVTDIEHGTIHEDVALDGDIRAALTLALDGGDRERARVLRREFEKGFDGIMKRVWPDMTVVIGIDNTNAWPEIEKNYAEGVRLLPFVYGSSEGILGHALWPTDQRKGYTLVTNEVVYEFIKFEDIDEKQPRTYLPDELETGQQYEVMITQISGLYRYRMGDIVRVVSFHDTSPIIEFQYRIGLILNVRYEKLDQMVVKASIKAAVARWPGVSLIEYAVAENNIIPADSIAFEKDELMPYYLIFLELEYGERAERITVDEKSMINDAFCEGNSDYLRLRDEDAISHPRVHIVKPGTFEDLKDYMLANTGASANQYKVPRKLRTAGMLEVMDRNLQN